MLGAIVGAFLLWWNPEAWVGFAGLTILGFAQAPLFPVLVSETPRRVGAHNAPNAVGFQVAFAGLGIAILPSLAGVLAQNISLDTIPVFIFVAAIFVFILHEMSVAQGTRIAQRAAAAAGD
jgi:fucose permease